MLSSVLTIVLAALLMQPAFSVSPTSPSSTPTPSADCVVNVFKSPPRQTNCTFYETTTTSTVYTDCGGCALKTKVLGVGLGCRVSTTVPGTATATVTACKKD
ncbi:hypothetical protein AA0119_g12773 [Alternaria tenuissima]|uniref:Uncharacterized protein n=1 Tax=Alternaria tenuissima TaxID=119927 RepID=A0A4Q4LYB9_9PLEO|nr:hypothetical protein AA0115_g12817 [Alternaria tenuissima]RYN25983.1 hypothetical protein AA0114_g12661 [Alternaria tenuissima]RYN86561.1 hypothetical protein AA0119_g12773 [Alternaria tenuissima]RYN88938.1 hypothetical protein AA0120_g6926 [Alternaria tenuissima]RYO13291.1 hypothetical protein AA0121_g8552 [Alternaria tenuissima]